MGIFLASGTAVMMCKTLSTWIFFSHHAQEFSIPELYFPASAKRRLQQRLRFTEEFAATYLSLLDITRAQRL